MFLLRETRRTVTEICADVGFSSLGTFSRTFRQIVGQTPSAYREGHEPIEAPHCVQLATMRPLGGAVHTAALPAPQTEHVRISQPGRRLHRIEAIDANGTGRR